jgi:hypothetical protein
MPEHGRSAIEATGSSGTSADGLAAAAPVPLQGLRLAFLPIVFSHALRLIQHFAQLARQRQFAKYFANVRNETVSASTRWHGGCMARKNTKKKSAEATRARVRKIMARPRMTRSARIAERNLGTSPIAEESIAVIAGALENPRKFSGHPA